MSGNGLHQNLQDIRDSKQDFYDSKVILQIRDPRDIAVSNYHQWKNTVNPYKRKLLNIPEHAENVPVFEYAMTEQFGIPRTIAFLNAWYGELEKTRRHLLQDGVRPRLRGQGRQCREDGA